MKDYDGALKDYEKATSIDPDDYLAWSGGGNMKSKLEDYYGAISALNKAIEINPQYSKAYNNRGIAKKKIGDEKGGCDDFKKAILLGNKGTEKWFKTKGAAWCQDM